VADRRLVITVCLREPGVVRLPIERDGPAVRLDARRITRELTRLVARRGLGGLVVVRDGCAGGCTGRGPNVDVRSYAMRAGEQGDEVALGWKTYVYSLAGLPALAAVIDENL
jgi:hypothetical protein